MYTDWTHWLSSLHPEEWLALLVGLILVDAPRYSLSRLLVCLWDVFAFLSGGFGRGSEKQRFEHCPSVCVVLAGYNEGPTIEATVASLYGSYPNLQVIVVDDGSEDDMYERAARMVPQFPELMVFRRPQRGGKSSALNSALPYAWAEIVVSVDADSELGPAAIWEIVQPFADPRVGIVSATVLARNRTACLVSRLQAYEYLQSIFLGRMVSDRLNILGIASGAFAAIRRQVLLNVGGWDVGPPEDMDLTIRVRKAAYDVAFAPFAVCYTDVPTTWKALVRQRLRWDQGAVVRHFLRKHADMLNPRSRGFRLSNLLMALDQLFLEFLAPYCFFVYVVWMCLRPVENLGFVMAGLYLLSLKLEFIQVATSAYYSMDLRRDLATCAVFPLMPIYRLMFMGVRLVANTQELFWRKSFEDNYVPRHVREATWHW
jgi:cellulose synthase/poly-beta-1,6-N-acetylglucosamine synthase-like glycosyltransferase